MKWFEGQAGGWGYCGVAGKRNKKCVKTFVRGQYWALGYSQVVQCKNVKLLPPENIT